MANIGMDLYYEELKKRSIAVLKERMKKLEEFLLRPVRKYDTGHDDLLAHIILISEDKTWPERDKLFYYLCEAVQVRYCDRELDKYLNPKVRKEKQILRRNLLDFIHMLENFPEAPNPRWRRAFECMENTNKDKDLWLLDKSSESLIKIPSGSTTAQCLRLKELDFLPKEEGL